MRHAFLSVTIVAAVLACTPCVEAADADIHSAIAGPATVLPGETGTFTVTYGNNGPQTALSSYVNILFPAGVPAEYNSISQAQIDAIEVSMLNTDTLGNVPLLFQSFTCDSLLIQHQGPSSTRPDPLDFMTSGASGSFSFATEFPMAEPTVAGLEIHSPASLEGQYLHIGRGSCTDCADLFGTCFGEPLTVLTETSVPATLADDGSADPTYGCGALVGSYSGSVVFFQRGGCQFGTKALNAQNAGAVGAVIVNSDNCGTGNPPPPNDPDCVISMAPGDFGLSTFIPVLMLSQNDGTPIITELQAATPVTVTIGGITSDRMRFTSDAFHAVAGDSDADATNNDGLATVLFATPLFQDGFESGDTTFWSAATP